ncbi:hypothetical protein Hanom_Chr15g01388701 [Helianthus anomalus]
MGSYSDMDDFQPFALLGDVVDDDILDLPPQLNDVGIIGHPEGEHVVEVIPLDILPLAIMPFIDDLDEDDDIVVPVFRMEHLDDDLGDEDVYDLVILEVAAPVVPIFVISSDSDTVIQDDLMPDDPVVPAPDHIPIPPHSPAHLPVEEPIQAPVSEGSTDHNRLMRFAPIIPPTDHTDEAGPSGHDHIPPNVIDLYYQQFRPVLLVPTKHMAAQHSPPHVMPTTDPYHPIHYPFISTDALIPSLQSQVEMLFHSVHELQQLAGVRPSPPPAHSPPHAPPPPPGSPPLPPLPPQMPPVDIPPVGLTARVLTLEQQIDFLIRLVHDLEDRISHIDRLLFPIPPPVFPPP